LALKQLRHCPFHCARACVTPSSKQILQKSIRKSII
jgi:hypothetical protein